MSWRAVVDEDNGLFSANYFKAFYPPFADSAKQYRTLAETTYRECSQFVHGNPTTDSSMPAQLQFLSSYNEQWHSLAESFKFLFFFAFCGRFGERLAGTEAGSVTVDILGDMPAVRDTLG